MARTRARINLSLAKRLAAGVIRDKVGRITEAVAEEAKDRTPDAKRWQATNGADAHPSHRHADGQTLPATIPYQLPKMEYLRKGDNDGHRSMGAGKWVTLVSMDLADRPRDPSLPIHQLKQEENGLAWFAADGSAQAAQASQRPLMIASSARIVTHALMIGGHHRTATDTARAAALRLNAAFANPSPDELSIYGALLLRGAIAASQGGVRHNAAELLDEAAEASTRLGHDGNHMWTAFGPNNVLCHRVHIALRLGDAGTAIDYARQVDLDLLPINERKDPTVRHRSHVSPVG
ncbi:hypothetical protein [[Actinomadura] parvosata]|nr:hypothetical protein [Nonomuraea sp. ATCC 55076]